ncbi:MAG TPA: DUF3099 domain-containing protein [Agromyces sp.]|nr:DUF3099 domain-containing protein [Agromyces sp.]
MKHEPLQSITTLPPSPEEERRARMIKYTIMMGIRVACIFALLFAQGWWILVFAAGAVFLPYFAVVVANVTTNRPQPQVERPGGLVPVDRPSPDAPGAGAADAAGHGTNEPSNGGGPADEGPEAAR